MSDKACEICGQPVQPRFRPFCSKRCADVDLSRWFTGAYVVPGPAPDTETDALPREVDADEDT